MAQRGQQAYEAINSSKLTNTVLSGVNYLSWARSITLALSGRAKLQFITGENDKPKPIDPEKPTEAEKQAMQKWQTSDHLIMTWLLDSMEPAVSDLFLYSDTSADLWQAVKGMYGQQNNFAHIFRLKQELQQEKQANKTNTEYYGGLKKKFEELKVYRPPTTDLKEIQRRSEEDEVFQYLAGLDSSYETVRSLILSQEISLIAQVVTTIQREESHRIAMGSPQARGGERHESQVFAAITQNPNFQNRNPTSTTLIYPYCKKKKGIQRINAGFCIGI